jgi:uncharacterized protein (DUF1697 family)
MGLANKIAAKVEPAHMKHYGQEQRSIVRQSSLKSAVSIISTLPLEGKNLDEVKEMVFHLATEFEEWVLR